MALICQDKSLIFNIAGSGKSSNFYSDIEAVMDAKSIDQYNFSSSKSFQIIKPLSSE